MLSFSATGSTGHLPTKGDLALAAALLGVAVLSGLYIDAARPNTVEPSTWWQWLLIVTPPALVALRRVNPALIVVLATIAQAGLWIADLPEVLLSMIVILYTAASEAGRKGLQVAIASSVALTVVTGIGVQIADDVTADQLPLIVLTCGTAVALGVNAARQRQTAEHLATAVAESRIRNEHERIQAVADERSHIARELHDIIGHTLSVIAVRAEAADRVAEHKPEAAPAAVAAIATAARNALDETRRVLAGLRESSAVDLAPPPDLDATRRLVTDLAKAGIDATLSEVGCDANTPPAFIAGGTYRIVQESLTNAIKHGGQNVTIDVHLVCSPTHLEIRISNSVQPITDDSQARVAGVGLTGMAERASVLGGTLDARQLGNRFVVEATLPTATQPNQKARQ